MAASALTAAADSHARRRLAGVVRLALCLLLIVTGGALRLTNLAWDAHQHVHPDERFIVWVASTMSWPGSLGRALDPAVSSLNPLRWPPGDGELAGQPRNYPYGHFPLYLLVGIAHLAQAGGQWLGETTLAFPDALQPLHVIGRHLAEYRYLPLAGRVISTVADLGTLLLVCALAQRAYGGSTGGAGLRRWAPGALAGGAYAVAVLPIQLSHFSAVDLVTTLAVVATVAMAVVWLGLAQVGRSRVLRRTVWLGAGALAGLAVGSKFSAILVVIPLATAALYALPAGSDARKLGRAGLRLAAALLAAGITFALTNPFALIEAQAYAGQLFAQSAMVNGIMDAPYTRQYIGSVPYWYYVQQLSQWGLGWPLGIMAWAGLLWVTVRCGLRTAQPAEVIMLAWALPYFALTGMFHTKFLRYMAPLLPFLLVFGAGLALHGARWMRERWGRRGAAGTALAGLLVVGWSVVWTLAFLNVYRQEHPWLQASRWIYSHVAEDSQLLSEHWDDALPLALEDAPGVTPARRYVRAELPLWDPDTPAKVQTLAQQLSGADYIVMASERLSRPIQRLPARYPMASQYYRLLDNGQLGYTLVAEFVTYPALGGIGIPDGNADESFSVYDHPHVRIYENTRRLSAGALVSRLDRYLPAAPAPAQGRTSGHASLLAMPSGQRSPGPRDRSPYEPGAPARGDATYTLKFAAGNWQPPAPDAPLTLSQAVDTLPVVADFRWDRLASTYHALAVVVWWLALSLFGWFAWPLLFPLMRGLADRGYGLARVAGWLGVGWLHWLGVSLRLWENRTWMLALLLLALGLAGALAWRQQRAEIAAMLRARRKLLLGVEAVFGASYLFFVLIRILNPDLWQPWNGGEKFMEFAFLNAILRSAHFPPYDPYFAGGIINYYYFGLYLVGNLIKLTGIAPEVAFNLAIPGLFALTASAIFSVAYSLAQAMTGVVPTASAARGASDAPEPAAQPAAPGTHGGATPADSALLAVMLALLMGNLDGARQFLRNLAEMSGQSSALFLAQLLGGIGRWLSGKGVPGFDFWGPSRVIPFTINEFPFWTFLFADLHPHLIAMPLGALVLGLALNWFLVRAGPVGERRPPWWEDLAAIGLLIVALGALGAGNTWDLPVYGLLVAGAFCLVAWRARDWLALLESALLSFGVGAAAILAYWPFFSRYRAQLGQRTGTFLTRYLAPVREASPLDAWLLVWGVFLFLALSYVVAEFVAWWRATRRTHAEIDRLVPSLAAAEGEPEEIPSAPDGVVLPAATSEVPTSENRVALPLEVEAADDYLGVDGSAGDPAAAAGAGKAPADAGWMAGEPSRDAADTLAPGDGVADKQAVVEDVGDAGSHGISPGAPAQLWFVLGVLALAALLWATGRPTAAMAALPLGLALALIFRRDVPPGKAYLGLLLVLGLGVVAGTELIYLRDFLDGGDWYRMNSVFKFSMPAWLFLALAGGLSLPRTWSVSGCLAGWLRGPWRVAAIGLVLAGMLFLFLGVPSRVNDRFPGPHPSVGALDGTAFMIVGRYQWPDGEHTVELAPDYRAIHWLLDNVSGSPVIAEAPAGEYQVDGQSVGYDYYRAGGLRVASLTGFPTFVGQHQSEQRPSDQVWQREEMGKRLFRTTDLAEARALLRELHVGYVYISTLERMLFSAEALDKFAALAGAGELEVVYQDGPVVIYRVR